MKIVRLLNIGHVSENGFLGTLKVVYYKMNQLMSGGGELKMLTRGNRKLQNNAMLNNRIIGLKAALVNFLVRIT